MTTVKADIKAADRLLKAAVRDAIRRLRGDEHDPIPGATQMLAEATRSADLLLGGQR